MTTKKYRWLLTILFLTHTTLAQAGGITVAHYMELEKWNAGEPLKSFLLGYLTGIYHAYGYADIYALKNNQPRLFCFPAKHTLGPENLRQLLNDKLKELRAKLPEDEWREFEQGNTAVFSLFVLQEAYPCNS